MRAMTPSCRFERGADVPWDRPQVKTASIIIDPKPESRLWADQLRNSLLVNWNVLPYSELNPKYFRMTDSTTPYLIYK